MKKKWLVLPAAALTVLALCGCAKVQKHDYYNEEAEASLAALQTEETVPATVPQDGDPSDVTCKGTYTGEPEAKTPVATVGTAVLTNEELQVWYWAEVAQYRQEDHERAPDFDRPLDTQVCDIDGSVNSWQQYFLRQALNRWHSAQALQSMGLGEGLEPEKAYQPNLKNHEIYLTDIPAMQYHYSYNLDTFHPNTLHQAYLDGLPEMLSELAGEKGYADAGALADAMGTTEDALVQAARTWNWAYSYYTELTYSLETEAVETADGGDYTVDIRHLLLVPDDLEEQDDTPDWQKKDKEPVIREYVQVAQDGTVSCSEEAWEAGLADAEALLAKWKKDSRRTEATFAQLTRENSDDPGSNINGGAYKGLRKGQLMEELDQWCFDETRQPGDTTIIRSPYGYHILYFAGSESIAQAQQEEALLSQKQQALIDSAREKYPMEVVYSKITLAEGTAAISLGEILYPDVAHQRYPEAPLYLQQDYPTTMYGGYPIRTNGCGITTMAMLASYMADEQYTPPEMCARYGNYSFSNGTDGQIFQKEAPVLGFYCKEKTYEPTIAKQALEDGYLVVSLQHKGYWTRGGHYLLVEKIHEDGTVQVRDSNIYNYSKLDGHDIDRFKWSLIPANGSAFWIFEKKVVNIPACTRCGAPEGVVEQLLEEDYLCEKCRPAMLRRNTYLNACGQ